MLEWRIADEDRLVGIGHIHKSNFAIEVLQANDLGAR